MDIHNIITKGIIIYFLQINRHIDIYPVVLQSIIDKHKEHFDPIMLKSKHRYYKLILSKGVFQYISENEELRKLILSKDKKVEWATFSEHLVRTFTSTLNQGDIGKELHKYDIVYLEDNKNVKQKLYNFIDNFIGYHSSLSIKEIYSLMLQSINTGVFKYNGKTYIFSHIESKSDNRKYDFYSFFNVLSNIKKILYFCYTSHIFYDFYHCEPGDDECKAEGADSTEDSQQPPVQPSSFHIPKISTLWLEYNPRLVGQDAEYMVGKNILLFGTYDLILQCHNHLIEDINTILTQMARSYGIKVDDDNKTSLESILRFLYNNYLRVSDIANTIIYEFNILYSSYLSGMRKNIFRDYINEQKIAEIMSSNISNYLLNFNHEVIAYFKNSTAVSSRGKRMHINGLAYFCSLINLFIEKYGYSIYDYFIEWLSKPYKINGDRMYLHTYLIYHNGIEYDPLEFLIYAYDEKTDVLTSYGLYILFAMLYREPYRKERAETARGNRRLIPFLPII